MKFIDIWCGCGGRYGWSGEREDIPYFIVCPSCNHIHNLKELDADIHLSKSLTPRSTDWLEVGELGLIIYKSQGPCWRCGILTYLIDLNFEAHLCISCFDPAWEEYYKAFNRIE